MCTLTIDRILDAIDRVGVSFRSETPYDLNLFGIRSNNVESNTFDDLLGCIYRDEQLAFQLEVWPATTDPGLYWLQNPSRVEGTAILVPGQYRIGLTCMVGHTQPCVSGMVLSRYGVTTIRTGRWTGVALSIPDTMESTSTTPVIVGPASRSTNGQQAVRSVPTFLTLIV